MKIVVIGAGLVGLTTALELQKKFPNATITILADKFGAETSSFSINGLYKPSTSFSGPTDQLTKKWIQDAYKYWEKLGKSDIASLAGVAQLSVYSFASNNWNLVKNNHLENILPVYRSASKPELELCPGQWNYGSYFITFMTDLSIYHPWATNKFTSSGGIIKKQAITSFADIDIDLYDVVVNCAGLGSLTLCNDNKIIPIRTQNLRVKASWLKTGFFANNEIYAVPAFNGSAILGNSQSHNSWNGSISELDSYAIRSECIKFLPSLHSSTKLSESVSLSGRRDVVRVELETLQTNDGKLLRIVHNYGYGPDGFMVSPGVALYVVQLVKGQIEEIVKESKL